MTHDKQCSSPWSRFVGRYFFAVAVMSIALNSAAQANAVIASDLSFQEWLKAESEIASRKMVANISPAGAASGAVIASPQLDDPNYFYHWIRDAALTMSVVEQKYEQASDKNAREQWFELLGTYIDFSRANQKSDALTGIGEPKFLADGRPFTDPWGRPQNDGPALRALTLIRLATRLLSENQEAYVRDVLYDGAVPSNTVIKVDLEYVAHRWSQKTFDLWEEVNADHFYTRIVQYAALQQGANFARRMGDGGAAAYYDAQAREIYKSLVSFWDSSAGIIRAATGIVGGDQGARSRLDSAIVLGILHANLASGEFSLTDSRVLSTIERMESVFGSLYAINDPQRFPGVGVAIGRYPEDIYSGHLYLKQGNPWVLATTGVAEFYYKFARQIVRSAQFAIDATNIRFVRAVSGGKLSGKRVVSGLVLKRGTAEFDRFIADLRGHADRLMMRVRLHANPDGSLSEQMDRNTGYMSSARDLTWSYASFITAEEASRLH